MNYLHECSSSIEQVTHYSGRLQSAVIPSLNNDIVIVDSPASTFGGDLSLLSDVDNVLFNNSGRGEALKSSMGLKTPVVLVVVAWWYWRWQHVGIGGGSMVVLVVVAWWYWRWRHGGIGGGSMVVLVVAAWWYWWWQHGGIMVVLADSTPPPSVHLYKQMCSTGSIVDCIST
ncbi:hypothetical protein J6590_048053 [Homalodisca vitripennis]|nr:hypothetical protein J6590_048053 [Homalodisca vitripennis]